MKVRLRRRKTLRMKVRMTEITNVMHIIDIIIQHWQDFPSFHSTQCQFEKRTLQDKEPIQFYMIEFTFIFPDYAPSNNDLLSDNYAVSSITAESEEGVAIKSNTTKERTTTKATISTVSLPGVGRLSLLKRTEQPCPNALGCSGSWSFSRAQT